MKFIIDNRNMAWLLNMVFYNLFRFEERTQKLFNYLVFLFLKNKKVRESYKKRGVSNPEEEVVKALKAVGISSILAGAHYSGLYFLLTLGIVNFVSGYLGTEVNLKLAHFAIMGVISYGFPYWFSFRKDRYLEYFREMEKLPMDKKRKSARLTFFIVLVVWMFAVGSFVFRIHY